MNSLEIAKALHILGVVLWIGGVAFVTLILIPAIRRLNDDVDQYAFFEAIEGRFAWQSRATTLLTGGTGFYLVWRMNLWHRFLEARFLWMHAMVAIWLLFTVMLFVLEPLVLHKWFKEQAKKNPEALMRRVHRLHVLLVSVSLLTVIAAMIGAH